MKRILLSMLVLNVLAFNLTAKLPPVSEIELVVDSLVLRGIKPNSPGVVVAVVGPQGAVFEKSYGMADLDLEAKITDETIFDIASVAKQFTAFAILQLVEQGVINLDDDIILHLSDFKGFSHQVSIRNLLQHTSGTPSSDVVRLLANLPFDMPWSQQDEINLIKQYPYLNFEPGSEFLYSNSGYSLLAEIIERASGLFFPDYLAKRVFEPIGMVSSFVLHKELDDESNLATGYGRVGDDFVVLGDRSDLGYGGGSIFANLRDMVAWAQNILKPTVGYFNFKQLISKPYNTLSDGDTINYTFGFNIRDYKGLKMVEHSGGVPGFRNQFMLFPQHETIIIIMCNNQSFNTRILANGIADFLFAEFVVEEEAEEMEFIEIDPDVVKKFVGYYLMPDGMEFGFFIDEGRFWFVVPDEKYELSALSENEFFLKEFNARCRFILKDDGTTGHLEWHQLGKTHLASKIDEVIEIDPSEFLIFAGNYFQPELNITYPVLVSNEELIIQTPQTFKKYLGFENVKLIHINGDKFYGGWIGTVEFTRDDYARIDGLVIRDLGRLRNIKFSRKVP